MKRGKLHTVYHKDGTVWAKGKLTSSKPDGHWTWFRKDGSKMRSGYFAKGKQTGEWITFDAKGRIVKKTLIK